MTDVELYKILTEIRDSLDLDDTEKRDAMKVVIDEVKDRLCAINVGDEIIRTITNELQVVTYIRDNGYFLALRSNGDTVSVYYDKVDLVKGNVVKTGKNYPQIAEVLKGLRDEKK